MIRLEMTLPQAHLPAALGRQLPFIESLAINETAKGFQKKQRQHQLRVFTARRPRFIERAVKIKPFSNKRQWPDVHAVVKIDPPGGQARADILAKFEEGGEKRPRDGSSLAIPTTDLKRTKTGIVPRSKRPRSFGFRRHGRGPEATVYVGKKRTFLIKYHDGETGGIYQRTGRRSRRRSGRRSARAVLGRDPSIRTLFRFTPRASIDRRLKFFENARGHVRANFSRNFHEAMRRALGAGDSRSHARRIALADVFGRDRES